MRLKMFIVDKDQTYLAALETYLMANYQHRFHLSTFSRIEFLKKSLEGKDKGIDILLINPELLTEEIKQYSGQITKTIFLTDGDINFSEVLDDDKIPPSLNKFQPCHRLVGKIMEFYGEMVENTVAGGERRRTKIISFYSPLGGSGKTTVAVATATLMAQQGRSVLYFSFEGISTLDLYFNQEGLCCDPINLFYLVKEKKKNIATKLEAMQAKDHETQVKFIKTPYSPLEWEELTEEDIDFLIAEFQNSGLYDYIIFDLSNSFDYKNLKVMNLSNKVMLLMNPNSISKGKVEGFIKELKRVPQTRENLFEKITLVMNRSSTGGDLPSIEDKAVEHHLPEDKNLWMKRSKQLILNSNSELSKGLSRLVDALKSNE